ncbi:hypothetical protein M433DRAFT_9863 [Acidomyces richmondensis BFW]|nr:hypothetical protein M433DRAFT_9863 [Acidomyces richmondensis BFW]
MPRRPRTSQFPGTFKKNVKPKDTRVLEDTRRKTGGSRNNGKGGRTKREREKSKPKPDRKYQQRRPQQEEEED